MKKRAINKVILYSILILFAILFCIFVIRLFSAKHLDDVSPEVPCDLELLEKADILYVIPKFNNQSIADNKEWCQVILKIEEGKNKELALHGVYHTYHEFLEDRGEDYLQEGVLIFEECFGFKPERFKPPQLKISKNNKELIKNNFKLDLFPVLHKVYHCNDSGFLPNWVADIV